MKTRVKLKYKGKLLLASCDIRHNPSNDIICWTFITDKKRILIAPSNIPTAPNPQEIPVEIRTVRDQTHTEAYKIITNQICRDMLKKPYVPLRARLQYGRSETLTAGTKATIKRLTETLPHYSSGEILIHRGNIKIREFVSSFLYEAVFQDGRAVLVDIKETPISSKQQEEQGRDVDSILNKLCQVVKEKDELKDDNAAMQKMNKSTSKEFQAVVSQFCRQLAYPLSLIYELRWNKHLSQDKIVKECSKKEIKDCRTKKRVGECIKEILNMAKEKGVRLPERITGPGAPPGIKTGYEANHSRVEIESESPDKIADKSEMESLIAQYQILPPADKKIFREEYGEDFKKELEKRKLYP